MSNAGATDWVAEQTPDPAELYNYIKPGINKLRDNDDKIPGAQHQVEESLDNAWHQLKRGNERNWSLQLNPYLVFNVESKRDFSDGNGQARLGGNIQVEDGEYQNFSSSLILAIQHPENGEDYLPQGLDHCCVDNGSREADSRHDFFHILERVHWDIDTGDEGDEDKPICHVQIGGELGASAFNYSHERFHYCANHLDKPRIPHPPMDPVLALNMIINQYESLESFNQHQWDGIINQGEAILWNPYFEATYGMASYEEKTILELMYN